MRILLFGAAAVLVVVLLLVRFIASQQGQGSTEPIKQDVPVTVVPKTETISPLEAQRKKEEEEAQAQYEASRAGSEAPVVPLNVGLGKEPVKRAPVEPEAQDAPEPERSVVVRRSTSTGAAPRASGAAEPKPAPKPVESDDPFNVSASEVASSKPEPSSARVGATPASAEPVELSMVIAGDQKLTNRGRIQLRSSSEATVQGQRIPRGTIVYGLVTLNQDRAQVAVKEIKLSSGVLKCDLIVIDDADGAPGIFVQQSETAEVISDAGQEVGNEVLNSLPGGQLLRGGLRVLRNGRTATGVVVQDRYPLRLISRN